MNGDVAAQDLELASEHSPPPQPQAWRRKGVLETSAITDGQSSLSSRARETASGRVATSSLRKMLFTWVLTVLNET